MNVRLHLAAAVIVLTSAVTGCSDDSAAPVTVATDEQFCEAMGQLIVLLAPQDDTSPARVESTFGTAAGWFEQATRTAPASIADEFAVYSAAYDEYAHYLRTVGYDLDVVFSTDEGEQLAIDTSHTLTPDIVHYVTDECGLDFEATSV